MNPHSLDPFLAHDERERQVEVAARTVIAAARSDQFGKGWRPKGLDEIAILLESLGYSPQIVAELWYSDLFAFAADVARAVEKYISDEERTEQRDSAWFARACRDYAVGALYSGPWIVAIVGLAVFGAALWSSLSTPLHLATAIAIGVYASLILAGVFSQAIARRLTFYLLQENRALMRWTLDRFIVLALAAFLAGGVLVWGALTPLYGATDALVAACFFTGSGVFQVSLAPLYTIRKFWLILGVALATTLATGTTFVVAFGRHVALPWEPIVLALETFLAGVLVMGATLRWIHRLSANASADLVPPSTRAVVGASIPYALYGACYFLMIVADHVVAGIDGGMFAYRSGYELGCDVALLAIVPLVGVINVALESLPRRILRGAEGGMMAGNAFDRGMLAFYLRSLLAVIVTAALVCAGAVTLGSYLLDHTTLGLTGAQNIEAEFVLRWATVGYATLMVGLLGAQFLFFLSRPRLPVIAAALGAFVVIVASIGLRVAGYAPATCVYALVAGIVVFSAVVTAATAAAMRRFTYSYYAAY